MKSTDAWTRQQFLAAIGAMGFAMWSRRFRRGAASASEYEQAVLAKRPVAYWRLGEDSGPVALDNTEHGHQGTYHGTPRFGQAGAIRGDANHAVTLDGKSAYVEVPTHPDFSQPTSGRGLSVEVWFRPDVLEFTGETADPYVHWLGKGQPRQHEWVLRFYSRYSPDRPNRVSAYLFNPEGGLGAGAYVQDKLTAGAWIHIVACYEPGDATNGRAGVHLYKDGEHRLGPPAPGTLYQNSRWQIRSKAGTAPLRFGTYSLNSFLTGGLDEVAIYPRVLTAEEIRENYQLGRGK
jgi:hypothetical protein